MTVARRAVLASAAASMAAPALVRLARADVPHVTFKLHHAFPSVSCLHANFLVPWARRIEEQSAGRVRIDIYPSMALGGQPAELFDQARDGVVDITWAMPSKTPGRFPKIEVFELPFVPPRRALVGSKALEDFAAEYLMDEFRDIHPICFSYADRGILHANRPVRTVADVKGLRLDVSTRFTAAAMAMLGGRPVPMPSGQLPLAIMHHVVDGCVVPWDMVPGLKLDTLLKTHTDFADDALSTTTAVLAMNKASYEKLPADLKKVIDDNSGQIAAGMAGTMWDLKAKAVADMVSQGGDLIVTLDPDEVARWRKSTQPVVDAWRKDMNAHKADAGRLLVRAHELFAKYASLPEPPAPPKPPVKETKVEPAPPAKVESPAPAPQPAVKVTPKPVPKVSVAAAPAHPVPSAAPATHWWQFWKSAPATASASPAPVTPPGQSTAHWWQFWKPAATPAPAAASASAAPVVPAAPAAVPVPTPTPAAPAAAAIAKPVPALPLPAPAKPFDIPL